MNGAVFKKTYEEMPFNLKEILRYAGCEKDNPYMLDLANECIGYLKGKLSYRVCYLKTGVSIIESDCDFGLFSVHSDNLSKNLSGCNNVIIFAATIGVEIDRLITKFKSISQPKAVMLQAIGAERVESLCDVFSDDIEKELKVKLRPRFSPGYGDLPLDTQKQIFKTLNCGKHIGVSLCDNMMMLPSKTVTAFIGY